MLHNSAAEVPLVSDLIHLNLGVFTILHFAMQIYPDLVAQRLFCKDIPDPTNNRNCRSAPRAKTNPWVLLWPPHKEIEVNAAVISEQIGKLVKVSGIHAFSLPHRTKLICTTTLQWCFEEHVVMSCQYLPSPGDRVTRVSVRTRGRCKSEEPATVNLAWKTLSFLLL